MAVAKSPSKPTILNLTKIDIINCSCKMDHLNFPVVHLPKSVEWYTHIYVCPINNTKIRIKFAYD